MDIGKKMAQRWVTDMPLFHCGRSYGSSILKRDFCSTNSSVVLHLVKKAKNVQGYMHTTQ